MASVLPATWRDTKEHLRKVTQTVNGTLDGRTNNTGEVTLNNAPSTTVVDARISTGSVILWHPTSSAAAMELGAGTMYVSATTSGSMTVTHVANSLAFRYAIIG